MAIGKNKGGEINIVRAELWTKTQELVGCLQDVENLIYGDKNNHCLSQICPLVWHGQLNTATHFVFGSLDDR